MSLIGVLVLLLVAAIAGAIGQSIAGYSLGGCLVSSAVHVVRGPRAQALHRPRRRRTPS